MPNNKEQTERWQSGDMPYGSAPTFSCIWNLGIWEHRPVSLAVKPPGDSERWHSYRAGVEGRGTLIRRCQHPLKKVRLQTGSRDTLWLESSTSLGVSTSQREELMGEDSVPDWSLSYLSFVDLLLPFLVDWGRLRLLLKVVPAGVHFCFVFPEALMCVSSLVWGLWEQHPSEKAALMSVICLLGDFLPF